MAAKCLRFFLGFLVFFPEFFDCFFEISAAAEPEFDMVVVAFEKRGRLKFDIGGQRELRCECMMALFFLGQAREAAVFQLASKQFAVGVHRQPHDKGLLHRCFWDSQERIGCARRMVRQIDA